MSTTNLWVVFLSISLQDNGQIDLEGYGHTDSTSDGGMLSEWWDDIILRGTKDWELIPEMTVGPKDGVISKKRYSAFFETDLERTLGSKGIQDLMISGVMMNLCCETTARDAFMREHRVFSLIDGTTTRKKESHLATLKDLGYGFACLLTCSE